jgi:F-type H+-transporting ATPase subunit b
VRTALAKRKAKIAELATAIETFKKNAELRKEEISRKLNNARSKAKEEIDRAKAAAQASTAESLAQVRQEATSTKTNQLNEIKKQFAEAQQQLSGQIETFASEMAAKILGRSI